METTEQIYKAIKKDTDFFRGYGEYLSKLLNGLDADNILKIALCFEEASSKGKTIFFAGNGGSASTASHFAQDIGEIVRKAGGRPFKTMSLTDHVSALTAIGNDYSFEDVFVLQMANHFEAGDVLVVISASGNSPNVIKAVGLAKERQGITIALTGFDGGKLAQLCDIVVCVKTPKGEYGPVEDVHMVLDHMITGFLTLRRRSLSAKHA